MKKHSVLFVAAMMVTGSAMADFVVGRTRPIAQADLVALQRTYPTPTKLVMNRTDGVNMPATSLSLTEDTGIRCFRAPCPSFTTTSFQVVGQPVLLPGNSLQYTAVANIVVTGPLGRPRIVTRTLTLVDHSQSILEIPRPYLWEITVKQGLQLAVRAVGNPTPIYTTAGVGAAQEAPEADEAN